MLCTTLDVCAQVAIMIPVLRMFEVVVATAFYSGICYMIFEGTGEVSKACLLTLYLHIAQCYLYIEVCKGA